MSIIANRIRALRESLGMSQDELAKRVGYTSRSSVAKVEAGEVDLTQTKIMAFAKALNTTPTYLMGIDDDQPEPIFPDYATEQDLQMLKDNPDLRILLSAGSKLKKSDIEFLVQMARRMDEE